MCERDLSSLPFFPLLLLSSSLLPTHETDKQTCSKFKAAPLECALGNCLSAPAKYPTLLFFVLPSCRSSPLQFPCREAKSRCSSRAADSVWSLSTSGRGKSEEAAQPRDTSRTARVIWHVWKEEEKREGGGGVEKSRERNLSLQVSPHGCVCVWGKKAPPYPPPGLGEGGEGWACNELLFTSGHSTAQPSGGVGGGE